MKTYRKSENSMRFVVVTTLFIVAVFLVLGVATPAQANLITNGDIEDNTAAGTTNNLSNATFNVTVADATAFGTSQEIDLVTGSGFGIVPQHGNWKLGLHTQEDPITVDAFSFDLSSPVVLANSYVLQFFAAGLQNNTLGPVEIGLSSSASSFGTLIFSGTPTSIAAWTEFNHGFIAPVNASFLTVRTTTQPEMFAFVDNFSLVLVPEPAALALMLIGGLALLRRRLVRRSPKGEDGSR